MEKKKTDSAIPLKVKEEKTPNKVLFIFKIILVIILLIVNIFLVIDLLNKKQIDDNTEEINIINEKPEAKDIKNKTWVYNHKKYIFNEDKTFIYYDTEKNYYSGTYESLNGKKALEEMGYTDEDIKNQFGDNINSDNVYSIQLTPTKRVINNVDKSKVIKKNTKWWLLLIVKDDNNAIGYNKTLDERYEFKKVD